MTMIIQTTILIVAVVSMAGVRSMVVALRLAFLRFGELKEMRSDCNAIESKQLIVFLSLLPFSFRI